MPNNLDIYVDYFRMLAVAHNQLQHNPLSETNDSNASMHFVRWDTLQVLAGLRTKIKFPVLVLDLYTNDLAAAVEYDIRQRPVGSFMILDKADPNKADDQQRVYANTEKIAQEILQQIWNDHYKPGKHGCKSPFKEFFFQEVTLTPRGKLFDNDFGWLVEFPFEFQKNIDIAKPPAEGTFDNAFILGYENEWLGSNGTFLGWRPNP